jgi:hypothetical protein
MEDVARGGEFEVDAVTLAKWFARHQSLPALKSASVRAASRGIQESGPV